MVNGSTATRGSEGRQRTPLVPFRQGPASVLTFSRCDLDVVPGAPWPFAVEHAPAIDAHWRRRLAQSPMLFNGTIYLLEALGADEGTFSGRLRSVEFKSFLYWRETGHPEVGTADCFGSAIVRSAEGHVLLGVQRSGHINEGLAYLPGGFLDDRDVRDDGRVDINASVAREIGEEMGLGAAELTQDPRCIVTMLGPQISIGVSYRSPLDAGTLRGKAMSHIAADADAELAAVIAVTCKAELEDLAVPPYTRLLLQSLPDLP